MLIGVAVTLFLLLFVGSAIYCYIRLKRLAEVAAGDAPPDVMAKHLEKYKVHFEGPQTRREDKIAEQAKSAVNNTLPSFDQSYALRKNKTVMSKQQQRMLEERRASIAPVNTVIQSSLLQTGTMNNPNFGSTIVPQQSQGSVLLPAAMHQSVD